MLPTVKRMNLKVSISPILDLWKRFRMSLSLGLFASLSWDSVLEFWGSDTSCLQRRTVFFSINRGNISVFKKGVLTIFW